MNDREASGRVSVHVDGFGHKNPIPAACRIGELVWSGSIQGTDPATGRYGETLEVQCRLMFGQVARIVAAAGGTPGDIIRMTVYMRDRTQRAALNPPWLALFPDPASRPARHTMNADLDGEKLVECDFVAVLGRGEAADGASAGAAGAAEGTVDRAPVMTTGRDA